MKRAMCVYFPHWPLQRLLCDRPTLREGATVVVEPHAARGPKVRHCSRRALEAGVKPGMPTAEVNALAPGVHLEEEDPRRDREALTGLAAWAERYSPLVGLEDAEEPECLLLDVSGCAACFGGEENLLRRARREFGAAGWRVRAAIADTVGAAWAIAHCVEEPTTAPTGETERHLAPLPVEGLRLGEGTRELLDHLGIRTIGQALGFSRRDLAARFDLELVRRLDQALGRRAEVIQPHPLKPEIEAAREFEYPVEHLPTLKVVLERLTEELAEKLRRRRVGAREVECRLWYARSTPSPPGVPDREGKRIGGEGMGSSRVPPPSPPAPLPPEYRGERGESGDESPQSQKESRRDLVLGMGLFRATQSGGHLCGMLLGRLERVRLEEAVVGMSVRVPRVEPIPENQGDFLEPAADEEALARLVDQLSNSLGKEEVVRAELAADHQPEHACRYAPAIRQGRKAERGKGRTIAEMLARPERGPIRPVKLWPSPVPLQVWGMLSGGAPARFRWGSQDYDVADSWGPERIETGWWRDPEVRRDYFVLRTRRGSRFWVFRQEEARWYLHGAFD